MDVLTKSRSDTYRRYATELIRFATGLVGPDDAQDVVAEAVMKALWSDGWANVRNNRAYLYRAVLNQSRMHHRSTSRRRQREQRSVGLNTVSPGSPDIDTWDALGTLSVPQRAAVYLIYWEDLTESDVASRLGVSERSVRRYLATARDRLREVLHD